MGDILKPIKTMKKPIKSIKKSIKTEKNMVFQFLVKKPVFCNPPKKKRKNHQPCLLDSFSWIGRR